MIKLDRLYQISKMGVFFADMHNCSSPSLQKESTTSAPSRSASSSNWFWAWTDSITVHAELVSLVLRPSPSFQSLAVQLRVLQVMGSSARTGNEAIRLVEFLKYKYVISGAHTHIAMKQILTTLIS